MVLGGVAVYEEALHSRSEGLFRHPGKILHLYMLNRRLDIGWFMYTVSQTSFFVHS